eukprot:TRINITY_DN5118_c0_g1_i2.p1 TRINITY_DN5118_c0_g1~~TRINITY_DN5118_c0_g1_i2.p1  ORF type:complete len:594 (-),score=74.62 TRINITY_DN5118_c0_g1_i2:185-1966(-)
MTSANWLNNYGIPSDVVGYVIQFLPVDVALKFSMLCRKFTSTLVWGNVRHFDNGDFPTKLSNMIASQLLKNAAELTRFESLIISVRGDESILNQLCCVFAPRLKRFERRQYTILILSEKQLLESFSPKLAESLKLPSINTALLHEMFAHDFPNLTQLQISQEELVDEDEDPHAHPMRQVSGLIPIRPLLASLASNTCQLRHLSIALTAIHDEKGLLIDAIKQVALAKKESLQTLDFAANADFGEGPRNLAQLTLKWLDIMFNGAVFDSSKWQLLPAAIEAAFGIHISKFRISGATIWQRIMLYNIVEKCVIPPLEHSRALFDAVYPSATTSEAAKINAFEFFIDQTGRTDTLHVQKGNPALADQYRDWLIQTRSAYLRDRDIRSMRFKTIALGLLGILSFLDCCNYELGEAWSHLISLGSAVDSSRPLHAFFSLLSDKYDMGGFIPPEYLAALLISRGSGHTVDFLAPIGPCQEPLVVFLRETAPNSCNMVLSDKSLFDPLQSHPTLPGTPLFLFALLHPAARTMTEWPYHYARAYHVFDTHFAALEPQLKSMELCYSNSEHITSLLKNYPRASAELKNFLLGLVSKEELKKH